MYFSKKFRQVHIDTDCRPCPSGFLECPGMGSVLDCGRGPLSGASDFKLIFLVCLVTFFLTFFWVWWRYATLLHLLSFVQYITEQGRIASHIFYCFKRFGQADVYEWNQRFLGIKSQSCGLAGVLAWNRWS
jgi:hypothetical protein